MQTAYIYLEKGLWQWQLLLSQGQALTFHSPLLREQCTAQWSGKHQAENQTQIYETYCTDVQSRASCSDVIRLSKKKSKAKFCCVVIASWLFHVFQALKTIYYYY